MLMLDCMDDTLKPEWAKRRESTVTLAKAKTAAATERERAASLTIEAEGPEFWRQLFLELEVNIKALPAFGVRGSMSAFKSVPGEERLRVEVAQKGSIAGMTYLDLFYRPAVSKIWSRSLEGDTQNYSFCVMPKSHRLAVVTDEELTPKTAKEIAESIVEQMLDRVSEAV
jgi:hypothetical protein